jgi:asparagine synthase (glutamine-hydrolysing)
MSGIAGIFQVSGSKPIENRTLTRMGDALKHRGPHARLCFSNEEKTAGFIYQHLQVKDDPIPRQLAWNENRTMVIVCDGEIYNAKELRRELEQRGHSFGTSLDAEVALHFYEESGNGFLDRLNGAFAFVIWHGKKRELFAARDRIGIKPFYYHYDGKSFFFASEIKALLAAKPSLREASPSALREYLSLQCCLNDKTLFKRVQKLPPAHFLSLKKGGLSIRRYWDLDFQIDFDHTESYFIHTLRNLIEDAVRLRMNAVPPLGIYLSGGLDSSTVTCIASSLQKNPLKAFSGVYKGWPDFDETAYAKCAVKSAHAYHFEIDIRPKDFLDSISRIIYAMDEPAAGPGVLGQYHVGRFASRHVRAVLGGEGGDEIFGGYARYLVAYLEECLKGAIFETQTREDKRFIVTFSSILPHLPLLKEYVPLLQSFWGDGLFDPMDQRYFKLIQKTTHIEDILNPEFLEGSEGRLFHEFSMIFNKKQIKSLLNRMAYFDLQVGLPAVLQVDDRTNASFSLELRPPLLDHRIVEFAASIPPKIKYRGGETKAIFKKAVKGIVPNMVLNRKDKKGFPVPLTEWFKGPLKEFVRDILLGPTTKKRGIYNTTNMDKLISSERSFGRNIWGLLCLELWFREFMD